MDKCTEKWIASKAKSGARKICGIGECRNAYDCGHSNKKVLKLPEIGKRDEECPLAKFHVKPDPRKLSEIPFDKSVPSDEEFFSLCAQCPHGTVAEDDDGYWIEEHDLDYCLNCPVFQKQESVEETRAEAACSAEDIAN